MAGKAQITISIDRDALEDIEKAAKAFHMSRSAFCSMVLSTTVQGDFKGFFDRAVAGLRESSGGEEKADENAVLPNSAPV